MEWRNVRCRLLCSLQSTADYISPTILNVERMKFINKYNGNDTTKPAAKVSSIQPRAIMRMTSPQFVSDESIYSEEKEIWRHGHNGEI